MISILRYPPPELGRYLVKCESARPGPGPGEVAVTFLDCDGAVVNVVVASNQVSGHYLITSRPLDVDGEEVLIELPREADSGSWRVWVDRDLDWETIETVMTR